MGISLTILVKGFAFISEYDYPAAIRNQKKTLECCGIDICKIQGGTTIIGLLCKILVHAQLLSDIPSRVEISMKPYQNEPFTPSKTHLDTKTLVME